jgi:signal transduction histidine kinase
MGRLERGIWLAMWPIGAAVGIFTVSLVRSEPEYSYAGSSAGRAAAELVAGYALVAIGLVSWRRRPESRFGLLLTLAGLGWFLLEWNSQVAGSAVVFTIGLALFLVAPPLVARAMLAYPDGRLTSWVERAGVAVAYGGAVLALGLLPALVYDPSAEGCSQCPRNLLLIRNDPSLYEDLNRVGLRLGLAWTLLLIVLALWRIARSSPARRLVTAPVLAAGSLYLAFLGAELAHSLDRGFLSNDGTDRRLWLAQAAALMLLALGVAWSWARGLRTRAAVASLVVELAESRQPGALRDALARTLHDPSLQLGYPLENGTVVDTAGRPIVLEGAVTPLVRGGRAVAYLAHRPGLLDDQEQVGAVARAARLALENERLQAEVRAQLESLRASRARIVEAGDAERRRLERDLHDGAQQRLVALNLSLALARTRADPSLKTRLDEAESELREALAELREIAHGIYPVALGEEGLAAAVEALAEETGASIQTSELSQERMDPKVEAAAYFVVAELARRSGPLRLRSERQNGTFVLSMESDNGLPSDLEDLEDRVGALDGSLVVEQGRIRVEIPCA